MKTRKLLVVVVAQVVLAFTLYTPAQAVVVTTTYVDGLATGSQSGPQTATTTQNATVRTMAVCDAVGGGQCFEAVIVNPFTFSYASRIQLPTLNAVFGGALADQTFRDSTKVHEDWHDQYARHLLASTYGRLETWSAAYESNEFTTAAAALAAGNADLANALTTAANAFRNDFATDVTNPAFGHQNAVAVQQVIGGVNTWRSQNPNWGAAAVAFADTINPAFNKTAGNCTCMGPEAQPVPEPGTGALLIAGAIAIALTRRRWRGLPVVFVVRQVMR
jgi:hypothetical protein